jgi:hypothetical protein
VCLARFGTHPVQVCHEWNTAVHVQDAETDPRKRAFTRDELQALFDYADNQVTAIRTAGRKGWLAAFQDGSGRSASYAFISVRTAYACVASYRLIRRHATNTFVSIVRARSSAACQSPHSKNATRREHRELLRPAHPVGAPSPGPPLRRTEDAANPAPGCITSPAAPGRPRSPSRTPSWSWPSRRPLAGSGWRGRCDQAGNGA